MEIVSKTITHLPAQAGYFVVEPTITKRAPGEKYFVITPVIGWYVETHLIEFGDGKDDSLQDTKTETTPITLEGDVYGMLYAIRGPGGVFYTPDSQRIFSEDDLYEYFEFERKSLEAKIKKAEKSQEVQLSI